MGNHPSSQPTVSSSSKDEFLSEEEGEGDDDSSEDYMSTPEESFPIHCANLPAPANTSRSIVMTPPLSIDGNSWLAGTPEKKKGALLSVLDLLKVVRPGSDLTKFQVPPQFNMPKSQLQLYGESVYCCGQDLLRECVRGTTALERFLAVVSWHISTCRPPPFGKAPYNPILGEVHHVSFGEFNLIAEQVSHHPPITALHVTDEAKLRMTWWHQAAPHFYGSGVEVTIHGSRILSLLDYEEDYGLASPKLNISFFPVPWADWVGDTVISCTKTALRGIVSFKGKGLMGLGQRRKVSGKIWDSLTGETLYELSGRWDHVVYLKDKKLQETRPLFDGRLALAKLNIPVLQNVQGLSDTESVTVWSSLTRSILDKDWIKAKSVKESIEVHQRVLRREREELGIAWKPKYFRLNSKGDWEWIDARIPVEKAPIFVPY